LPPTATHVVADSHETERNTPVPPLTVRAAQVFPPSLLTTIDAPTATQNDEVGQSTEPKAPKLVGRIGTLQAIPPSDESKSWPEKGPF
jgi:hypothetical protein